LDLRVLLTYVVSSKFSGRKVIAPDITNEYRANSSIRLSITSIVVYTKLSKSVMYGARILTCVYVELNWMIMKYLEICRF
jgi:hypothetical protein